MQKKWIVKINIDSYQIPLIALAERNFKISCWKKYLQEMKEF